MESILILKLCKHKIRKVKESIRAYRIYNRYSLKNIIRRKNLLQHKGPQHVRKVGDKLHDKYCLNTAGNHHFKIKIKNKTIISITNKSILKFLKYK